MISEFPIVNLALIVLIETSRTSDDFQRVQMRGRKMMEIDRIAFIDALPDALRSEAERADLHPTSAIRALILSRQLE